MKKIIKVVSLVLLLFLISTNISYARANNISFEKEELETFIDSLFLEGIENNRFPGGVFILVKDGEIFFKKGYGYAHLRDKKAVDPDNTIFRVESVSKVFTGTAAMQMVERGRLELDQDVNNYLSHDLKLEYKFDQPITLHHLLTHTAGFDDTDLNMYTTKYSEIVPLKDFVKNKMPRQISAPGDYIRYSNHGIALVGYLVEKRSGLSFNKYMEKNIFDPLNMEGSSFGRPIHPDELAMGYIYQGDSFKEGRISYHHYAPAGGLTTTGVDMAKFMIAHLNGGQFKNKSILKEATIREMQKRQMAQHQSLPGICYTFFEDILHNKRVIKHGGDNRVYGASSMLFMIPEDNIGFFLSVNSIAPDFYDQVINKFMAHYYPAEGNKNAVKDKTFSNKLDKFAGNYRVNRYSHDDFLKLTSLFQIKVEVANDRYLAISTPTDKTQWEQVGPLLFKEIDSKKYISFDQNSSGQIKHMFWGGATNFEKVKWYETTTIQIGLLIFFIVIFLAGFIVWVLKFLKNRKKGQIKIDQFIAFFISLLNLTFLVLFFLALLNPGVQFKVTTGLPTFLKIVLLIPWLTILITPILIYYVVVHLKNGVGSFRERVYYLVTTFGAILFIPYLIYWNLML